MGDTPKTPITQQAKKAITDKAMEVGEAVASSGLAEAISQASIDTKSMGDSWNTGYQKSQDSAEEKSPQPTGGRKRRKKSRKSRRRKSRKSRRSRRRKSKRKTRRRRKRRNKK